MKLRKLFTFALLALLSGCWMNGDLPERSNGDELSIIRYDRLQSEFVRFNSVSALQKMSTKYGRITQILAEEILSIGTVSDRDIDEAIKQFYSDTTLLRLMDDVEVKFADLGELEKELSKGFKRLKKELPSVTIPHIYTQISALNESIVLADSLLGISLDKYMGEDYPLYTRFYYEYQCRSMRPDRIVPDCLLYYLLGSYPLPPLTEHTLLERMLRQGQVYYVLKEVLGYRSVADVIGFSDAEKKWWSENKAKVWAYMLQNNLLKTTDPMVVRKLIYPAPFTSFFGEESPAFIGICMGGEIISGFMKQNKHVTIEELLRITDYRYVLNNSGFNASF